MGTAGISCLLGIYRNFSRHETFGFDSGSKRYVDWFPIDTGNQSLNNDGPDADLFGTPCRIGVEKFVEEKDLVKDRISPIFSVVFTGSDDKIVFDIAVEHLFVEFQVDGIEKILRAAIDYDFQ